MANVTLYYSQFQNLDFLAGKEGEMHSNGVTLKSVPEGASKAFFNSQTDYSLSLDGLCGGTSLITLSKVEMKYSEIIYNSIPRFGLREIEVDADDYVSYEGFYVHVACFIFYCAFKGFKSQIEGGKLYIIQNQSVDSLVS